MSKRDCEIFCTSYSSCVGYSYKSDGDYCHIFPSDGICPSGFKEVFRGDFKTPISHNDLMPNSNTRWLQWVCSAKNPGKLN